MSYRFGYPAGVFMMLAVFSSVILSVSPGIAQGPGKQGFGNQALRGKEMMVEGAKIMNEGRENIFQVMKGSGKPGEISKGEKMIGDGFNLIMRANDLWIPMGDNMEEARGMMLQGARMMLDGKNEFIQEINDRGMGDLTETGQDMMLNGQVMMSEANQILGK